MEKVLIMSNSSFRIIVFKCRLLALCQNASAYVKGFSIDCFEKISGKKLNLDSIMAKGEIQ